MALPVVAILGELPPFFSDVFQNHHIPHNTFSTMDNLLEFLLNNVTDLCVLTESRLNAEELSSLSQINPDMLLVLVGEQTLAEPVPGCIQIKPQIESRALMSSLLNMLVTFKNREEFAAMILHDIRSPVNSIIAYLEMLENGVFGKLNEGQSQILGNVMQLGDMLIELAEDLNTVHNFQSGKFQLNPTQFDFTKTMDAVFLSLWAQADQKEVVLRKSISKNCRQIYADPSKVERLLMNLLTNAIKFSPAKGSVTVTATRLEKSVRILVSDEGPGIDEAIIGGIFEKFFRAENGQKGYGLGLYIARLITESHGGKIAVQNNKGAGCTFTIDLPAAIHE